MTDIIQGFAAAAADITISLDALANNGSATSSAIDTAISGSLGNYVDALTEAKIVSGASGVSSSGTVEIYTKGSIDNSDFDDDANDRLIGVLNVTAAATTYKKSAISVAAAFGGVLPPYLKLRVVNKSGAALGTGSTLAWRGVKGVI